MEEFHSHLEDLNHSDQLGDVDSISPDDDLLSNVELRNCIGDLFPHRGCIRDGNDIRLICSERLGISLFGNRVLLLSMNAFAITFLQGYFLSSVLCLIREVIMVINDEVNVVEYLVA